MRVPNEYAKLPDAELVVRVNSPLLGKLEAAKKLNALPAPEQAAAK